MKPKKTPRREMAPEPGIDCGRAKKSIARLFWLGCFFIAVSLVLTSFLYFANKRIDYYTDREREHAFNAILYHINDVAALIDAHGIAVLNEINPDSKTGRFFQDNLKTHTLETLRFMYRILFGKEPDSEQERKWQNLKTWPQHINEKLTMFQNAITETLTVEQLKSGFYISKYGEKLYEDSERWKKWRDWLTFVSIALQILGLLLNQVAIVKEIRLPSGNS